MKLFSPSISFNIFLGIANKHFYHKLKGKVLKNQISYVFQLKFHQEFKKKADPKS